MLVMLFQKYDPYVPYVDKVILSLKDGGIIEQMFDRVLPYRGMKEHAHFEEDKIVTQHIILPIIFLLVGNCLGLLSFIVEVITSCKGIFLTSMFMCTRAY